LAHRVHLIKVLLVAMEIQSQLLAAEAVAAAAVLVEMLQLPLLVLVATA
jgi:hypothetical protein